MSGGGDSGASALRKQQQQNQLRIQQGLGQINAVFSGGSYGTNPLSGGKYDSAGSYFTSTGDPYAFNVADPATLSWLKANPIMGPRPGRTGRQGSGQGTVAINPQQYTPEQLARAQSNYGNYLAQQGQLYTGKASSTGFNDDFYNQRKQAQLDVQLPQMGQQFQQTQKGLAYQLANKGLLRSSTATNLGQSLKNEFGFQKQNLDQAAQQSSNQLRSSVEGQRQQIVGQLEASADPAAALSLATGAATSLNAPSTFAPLANLFSNWQNLYLANQVGQQSQQQQMFNPYVMFGNQGVNNPLGSGSSRIVS